MKVKINRMDFELSGNTLPLEGHGPFVQGMSVNDTDYGWILQRLECDHCELGFWTIHAGYYNRSDKEVYLIEELELRPVGEDS